MFRDPSTLHWNCGSNGSGKGKGNGNGNSNATVAVAAATAAATRGVFRPKQTATKTTKTATMQGEQINRDHVVKRASP